MRDSEIELLKNLVITELGEKMFNRIEKYGYSQAILYKSEWIYLDTSSIYIYAQDPFPIQFQENSIFRLLLTGTNRERRLPNRLFVAGLFLILFCRDALEQRKDRKLNCTVMTAKFSASI